MLKVCVYVYVYVYKIYQNLGGPWQQGTIWKNPLRFQRPSNIAPAGEKHCYMPWSQYF